MGLAVEPVNVKISVLYADCNIGNDGCETYILDDRYNCGGCGIECGEFSNCIDGTCVSNNSG
jgi:hypothetical protein